MYLTGMRPTFSNAQQHKVLTDVISNNLYHQNFYSRLSQIQ